MTATNVSTADVPAPTGKENQVTQSQVKLTLDVKRTDGDGKLVTVFETKLTFTEADVDRIVARLAAQEDVVAQTAGAAIKALIANQDKLTPLIGVIAEELLKGTGISGLIRKGS